MAPPIFIVRCKDCGVAQASYNDPRRPYATIGCRTCSEVHDRWTIEREDAPPRPPTQDEVAWLEELGIQHCIPREERDLDERRWSAAHRGGEPLVVDESQEWGEVAAAGPEPMGSEKRERLVFYSEGQATTLGRRVSRPVVPI